MSADPSSLEQCSLVGDVWREKSLDLVGRGYSLSVVLYLNNVFATVEPHPDRRRFIVAVYCPGRSTPIDCVLDGFGENVSRVGIAVEDVSHQLPHGDIGDVLRLLLERIDQNRWHGADPIRPWHYPLHRIWSGAEPISASGRARLASSRAGAIRRSATRRQRGLNAGGTRGACARGPADRCRRPRATPDAVTTIVCRCLPASWPARLGEQADGRTSRCRFGRASVSCLLMRSNLVGHNCCSS